MNPTLRFKQDDGSAFPDWEEKKLGDLCYLRGRIGYRGYTTEDIVRKTEGVLSLSPSNIIDGFVNPQNGTYITVEKYEESPEIKVAECDIVFTKTGSTIGKVGYVKKLNERTTINPQIALITSKNCNPFFLFCCFSTLYSKNYVRKISVGGAIPTLSQEELKKMAVLLPCPEEQQKIASFLSAVDEKITLTDRRLELMKQYKKGVMQQIFSQEIRFKDDDGNDYPDWEEKKLGDVITVQRGGSPRPISDYITTDEDGLNWIKIGDVSPDSNAIRSTKEKIRKEGLRKTRQVFKGDLILSNSMSYGRPYILEIDGCIHDGWLLLRDDRNSFDKKFLCFVLSSESILRQYKAKASGGVVDNLNSELVQSVSISIPSLPEQQKIASFLSAVDEKITLIDKQLENLKQYKKSLLQQMFV